MKLNTKPTLPAPEDESAGWAYKAWVSKLSDSDLQNELQFHENVGSKQHLQMGSLTAEIEKRGLTVLPKVGPSKTRPVSRIGGSILPSSDPTILKPLNGLHGLLQVIPIPEADTYGLFFTAKDGKSCLAQHSNGYSCHNLAVRLVDVWSGKREQAYALAQFDYILSCGGLGKSRESIAHIAAGLPEESCSPLETMQNTNMDSAQQEFVEKVVEMHLSGSSNVLERYRALYSQVMGQHADESDADYVRRCATQDYTDCGGSIEIEASVARHRGPRP